MFDVSLGQVKIFKDMRLVLLSILFLIISHFICSAQELSQTIRGSVYDAHSNQPLIGAYVIIDGTDPIKGSVTYLDGEFRISDVPVGRHTLQISFIGYEDQIIPELLVGSGKEVVLNIELIETITNLEEIVILADQEKGDPLNEMATISALSFNVEETGRYAATFDDPARAALSFAGVRGAGDDILNEIVIRGNSPRGLLWRIEGVEVPNPNHFGDVGSSAGGISMLSNNMLSRSDFFTGAFPAEYGNALSGVFDINLRKGNNEKREYAIEAGLIGLQAAAEGPLNSDSGGSYLANYRYSTLAVLSDLGILSLSDEDTRFSDLAFNISLPVKKVGAFSLWGLGGISNQTFVANPSEQQYFNEAIDVKMGVMGLKHIYFLDDNTFLETSLSASGHLNQWSYDSLNLTTYQVEDFENKSLRLSTMLNRKFNARNTARVGIVASQLNYNYFSYYYDEDNKEFITDVNDKGDMNRFQSFAQWQHRLSEEISFNLGFHYNRLNLGGQDSFEPRLGTRIGISPGQFLSAGIGVHSRTETPIIYLAQREDDNGDYYMPNKDLEMTKAIHYVVGYENKLLPDIRFKIEAYYQDLYDVIVIKEEFAEEDWMKSFAALNTTSGYTSLPLSNEGSGYNYGLEFTLEKYFTRSYYFLVTTSLFQSKYHGIDRIIRNTRFNGNYTTNLLAGKEFKVGRQKNNLIGLNGKIIWAGNNRSTPIDIEASMNDGNTVYIWDERYSDRLDDYLRIDFGVSYRKNKRNHSSIITLNVQNVTNRLNEGGRYFSDYSNTVQSWEQLGILPNLSYRLEF
jgi:hypothetical protein